MQSANACVSTDGQSLEAQHAALAAPGAERLFAEKQSGIKTDRAALARCMRPLECWGCAASEQARSARSQHQGLAEHACAYWQGWC
jgi:hypothetical protein